MGTIADEPWLLRGGGLVGVGELHGSTLPELLEDFRTSQHKKL